MIYLDNAATSFPKPKEVIESVNDCLENWCANPGRSGHRNSMKSARKVYAAREAVAGFIGASPEQIIFTWNCTGALNMGIKGILKKGDHVVTTVMEHNSVLRTLFDLKKDGVKTTLAGCDERGVLDVENIRKAIRPETKIIVCMLSSNVTGNIMPIKKIGEIAKENNIIFMVDAAQGLGTIHIDVSDMNIDVLCSSGHKSLMGPQGTGFIYISDNIEAVPYIQGGTGTFSDSIIQPAIKPEGFESGTLNVPGIVGLRKGIEFIEQKGIDNIRKVENDLIGCLQEEIKCIPGIITYGIEDPCSRTGILSFNIEGIDCEEVAEILDEKYDISVRAGYMCVPMIHKYIGTDRSGCIRVSVGPFSTYDDIIKTAEAIKKIASSVEKENKQINK